MIRAHDVSLSFSGNRVLDRVDIELDQGVLTALIGPNGAGKSTLFSVLAGDQRPDTGTVLLGERPVGSFSAKELARLRAVLPQDHTVRFSYSVEEIVSLARLSYAPDPILDEQIVTRSIEDVEMAHMRRRDVQTLSGGESGRAAFARVLAQTTPIILLDEPTSALDLRHQEAVLRRARRLARKGACVIVVLHDLNLAAAYADRIVLMDQGRIVADGAPREVLTVVHIEAVYGQPVLVTDHPTRACPLIVATDDVGATEDVGVSGDCVVADDIGATDDVGAAV
ncbi:iron complex transport system ATP-binding protein [Kineosphaera limosa]|uniref:Hemin ABC transporter ATP-binding protein n=1 Tax=Kineosphaera limosa NBRC 100340 TaxID=1184609 RepID=K6WCH8_9MICO|nr:heme ABC transporter ATP-binding protein [Kineosphaera limosa]NYE00848.1 iron complex transport system ATP-binding protein [Kineosphaera limosa]GAB96975.1 hemin ABC transporter ATP-binding protein [Kineosphaera limosa NBRC 100340]